MFPQRPLMYVTLRTDGAHNNFMLDQHHNTVSNTIKAATLKGKKLISVLTLKMLHPSYSTYLKIYICFIILLHHPPKLQPVRTYLDCLSVAVSIIRLSKCLGKLMLLRHNFVLTNTIIIFFTTCS